VSDPARDEAKPASHSPGHGGEVRCPWCGSAEVERVGEFGPQLMTHAYLCRRCHSPFEVIRR
jgi:DNA-directed RNA polymerase subunit RPC12/RpoP